MSNKKKSFVPFVWIVSGPSGSGKTTLCSGLLKDPFWKRRLLRSVSVTTRALRSGETQGKDYTRISEARFREGLHKGAFLEHEKIFGAYYGTPRSIVERARRQNKDVLLCIDVKGAQTVRRRLGPSRVRSIFVETPGIGALARRLRQRSTEGKKDIEKRLRRVKIEFSHRKDYDHIVVNDVFEKALKKMKSILKQNQTRLQLMKRKRDKLSDRI